MPTPYSIHVKVTAYDARERKADAFEAYSTPEDMTGYAVTLIFRGYTEVALEDTSNAKNRCFARAARASALGYQLFRDELLHTLNEWK